MENTDGSESKAASRGGVSRVLAKLELSIQSGDYYEAHQMYRTLYFRYLSQKRYSDCLELLFKGAMRFLLNEQYGSGADLGLLVVDTLEKAKNVADYELWIQRLGLLISKINPNIVERETLLVSVNGSSVPICPSNRTLNAHIKNRFRFRLGQSNGAVMCRTIKWAIR